MDHKIRGNAHRKLRRFLIAIETILSLRNGKLDFGIPSDIFSIK